MAKARLDEAQRELDHTVIYAPFDGIVTQVDTVQPGMYLAASTAAFGIISTEHVWVEANPKETELTWVKPGDPVDVTVDTYPGRAWKAEVESIAPNSGSEFSVLPAQNTSGNWVKVVQRIPVRIRVDRKPGDPELRAGMSVEAEIDTGHQPHLARSVLRYFPSPALRERTGEGAACRTQHPHLTSPATRERELALLEGPALPSAPSDQRTAPPADHALHGGRDADAGARPDHRQCRAALHAGQPVGDL